MFLLAEPSRVSVSGGCSCLYWRKLVMSADEYQLAETSHVS